MTERELLEAARAGNGGAMEELLTRHERQIYRFGLRMCGNPEDAREVLQETMLAAFRNLPGFRGDAQLSTWLYQIARSFCVKLRRPGKSVRDADALDDEDARTTPSGEPAPDESAHAHEIGEALAAGISALPEANREALVLRDVEGLSAEEAAAVVGVDVGALKSRLHRARLELRAHLATLLGEQACPPTACPALAHELAAYVEADIDQAACTRIEAHLAECPRCAGVCDNLKRSVSLCRRIPGDEVPSVVRVAVRRALGAVLAR